VAHEYASQFERAISLYNRLLFQKPQDLPALNNRAGCYMNLNQYEQAIAGFKHVLGRVTSFSRAVLGLAIAQDLSGQSAAAILGYRRYLTLQPQSDHATTVRERLEELTRQRA
jgi:tetratricopeptide (TPR) repeat protein